MIKLALAVVAMMATTAAANSRHARAWRPSERTYPYQGIDVSHHQGRISWSLLKRQGVDFAYIKATEGADWRDPRFAANRHGAVSARIPYGPYHYYTLCRSGADQAANFLAMISNHRADLPPAVDLEFGGNCARRPSRNRLLREIGDFLYRVEYYTGRPVLIYTAGGFEKRYRITEAFDGPLWLRRLNRLPHFSKRPWTIWQVSASRRLRGIRGAVDWNVARRDPSRIGTSFARRGRD